MRGELWRRSHPRPRRSALQRRRWLGLGLLALVWLLAQPGPALAQQVTTVRLTPVAGTSVSGTATIAPRDGAASVTIEASGLAPGTSYLVSLHAGTCAQPSASAGRLGSLQADAAGRASLTASRVAATATGAPVDPTLDLLADGARQFTILGPAGPVACGEIQGLTAPSRPGMPRTGAGGSAGGPLGLAPSALAGPGLLLAALGLGRLASVYVRRRPGRGG